MSDELTLEDLEKIPDEYKPSTYFFVNPPRLSKKEFDILCEDLQSLEVEE